MKLIKNEMLVIHFNELTAKKTNTWLMGINEIYRNMDAGDYLYCHKFSDSLIRCCIIKKYKMDAG